MTRNLLITRCPDCQTSFRATVELLLKADGTVRCGRCGAVFSAFNSLADTRTGVTATATETITLETEAPPPARATRIVEPEADAVVVDTDLISEIEVDEVLASENGPEPLPPWTGGRRASRASNPRLWLAGVVAAMIVLLAQLAHHFRSELLTAPVIGSPLGTLYERLGVPAQSDADPDDYEIVNWVATAEANAELEETLSISAGIHNRSAEARPLPLLFIKLTDRFDNPVGTRYFEPGEYLSSGAQMVLQPGTIAAARLELVDPGPEAFGFEVDICVRIGARALRCKSDMIFE